MDREKLLSILESSKNKVIEMEIRLKELKEDDSIKNELLRKREEILINFQLEEAKESAENIEKYLHKREWVEKVKKYENSGWRSKE